MRWFWIDRFTEFVSGKYAVAVKNVSLNEDVVDEYTPGCPSFPSSLIVEGMAQTGGLMIGQTTDFKGRVVLAKISKAKFYFEARPGDCLTLKCTIMSKDDAGAIVQGTVHRGDELQAEIDLMFGILQDDKFDKVMLYDPVEFCRMIRILNLFDVAVYEDGTKVHVPDHMRDAEEAQLIVQ